MEINNKLFDALGMTLVDSIWQGAIIISIAFLGLWLMRRSKASLRHNFLLACTLALPILGIYSFSQHYEVEKPVLEFLGSIREINPQFGMNDPAPEVTSTPFASEIESFSWFELRQWIGIVWIVGMLLLIVRSIGAYWHLNKLKADAIDFDDPSIINLFNRLQETFDIKLQARLRQSERVSSPVVFGYFKPIVLLPLGLIQGLSTDELEAILMHELAHLKRNDFLVNIVINGLRVVYFYHPVFWWLQNQIDNEREFASDKMVLERQANCLVLVRALAKTQEFSMVPVSLGFAGSSKNQLLKRVNKIMKKKQKPNWTGLILPCLILISAFLFTSQRKKGELTSPKNSEESVSISSNDTLPQHFGIDISNPDVFEEINESTADGSTLFFDISDPDQSTDTLTVAKATMELLEDPSPISVETKGNETVFKRNGKVLEGEVLTVYQKAYEKLKKYSSNAANQRMSRFMGGSDDLSEKRKREDLKSSHLAEQMALERELEKRIANLSVRLQNTLNREKHKLEDMMLKAAADPDNAGEETINAQKKRVELLESELMAYQANGSNLEKYSSYIKAMEEVKKSENDWETEVEEKRREVAAQRARIVDQQRKYEEFTTKVEEVKQNQEDILRITTYSEEDQLYEFPLGEESHKEFSRIKKTSDLLEGTPILELNGVLKPIAEFYKLEQKDIATIRVLKGKAQRARYPEGETDDYDGLIVIKTFEGMTGLRLKGNGTASSTRFSKDVSSYTFSEDNKGQAQAMSNLEAAQALEEDFVVVFNGKFMPKDYVFKYKDAFIKEINIYKGDALKKFPKRKVKDHAAIIEVITKKMPRRKN